MASQTIENEAKMPDSTEDDNNKKEDSESSPSTNKDKNLKRKAQESLSTPPCQTKKTKISESKTLSNNAEKVKSFLDNLETKDHPAIPNVKAAYTYIYQTISPTKSKKQKKTKKTKSNKD